MLILSANVVLDFFLKYKKKKKKQQLSARPCAYN